MTSTLDGKHVAILATDGYERAELDKPLAALKDAGATVTILSLETGTIKGWDESDWGGHATADKKVADAKVADYDGLVLPGGAMNPDKLRVDKDAVAFVRDFAATGKPLAAICHAPWLLVEAGVARGRTLTSFPSVSTDLKNAGATWQDKEVVIDGNLITSRNPHDLPAFNDALIKALAA